MKTWKTETFRIVSIGIAVVSGEKRTRKKSAQHLWRCMWRFVALMKVV